MNGARTCSVAFFENHDAYKWEWMCYLCSMRVCTYCSTTFSSKKGNLRKAELWEIVRVTHTQKEISEIGDVFSGASWSSSSPILDRYPMCANLLQPSIRTLSTSVYRYYLDSANSYSPFSRCCLKPSYGILFPKFPNIERRKILKKAQISQTFNEI